MPTLSRVLAAISICTAIYYSAAGPSLNGADHPQGPAVKTEEQHIARLLGRLSDNNKFIREEAARALAKIVDPKIPGPVRKRIAVERDFHVKLALHHALACQGDKQALAFLIDSLTKTGHLGSFYLDSATGRDFGWQIDKYRKWYANTSNEQYRAFVNDRWKRKPMMEEWSKFASLYQEKHFSSQLNPETGKLGDRKPMTAERMKQLSELPTAKAWSVFESALGELQKKGNRKEAARLFGKVATEYPNTYYADQSKELADLLNGMIAEDSNYEPPQEIASLTQREQIAFHIFNLRDVVGYQFSQPGYCAILSEVPLPDNSKYNAARALRDIGEPAVPDLIALLSDRRPIRAVGYWRNFVPMRIVLRYQDAAAQIISAIRSGKAYKPPMMGSYFSTERPDTQQAIIESLRASVKTKPHS